jgi:hypothetical protein
MLSANILYLLTVVSYKETFLQQMFIDVKNFLQLYEKEK